jgi:hypothetical protein
MNPDVIQWSDDDVMGDREVIEVCPADDKEVEADTPLSAARRVRFWQTQSGTTVFEVSEVCLCPAERCGPPVTIDLTPDAD